MESIFLVKLCSRCDNNQPLSQFRKYKENSYSSVCKKCMNYMDKIRKQQLRQKRAETFMVKCEKCHEEKALKYFAKLKKFYKKKNLFILLSIFFNRTKNTVVQKST